jgi:hypothetical protein
MAGCSCTAAVVLMMMMMMMMMMMTMRVCMYVKAVPRSQSSQSTSTVRFSRVHECVYASSRCSKPCVPCGCSHVLALDGPYLSGNQHQGAGVQEGSCL